MQIHIEDLKFQAIIGILDFERTTPQDVIVTLSITYNYIQNFINYADVATCIEEEMQKQKFLLLEDALSSISHILKNKFAKIDTLNLKITKPSIMPNCRVSLSEIYTFDS